MNFSIQLVSCLYWMDTKDKNTKQKEMKWQKGREELKLNEKKDKKRGERRKGRELSTHHVGSEGWEVDNTTPPGTRYDIDQKWNITTTRQCFVVEDTVVQYSWIHIHSFKKIT